jgi:ribose-phosphate pyrophosphokinase
MKRYSDYATLPYAFGVKKRDWATGKIEGLTVMNKEVLEDKPVLIIDDICSRGGTFYYSALEISKYTSEPIYLYITHCEKTILDGDLLKNGLVKRIYTANALFDIPEEYKDIIIEI